MTQAQPRTTSAPSAPPDADESADRWQVPRRFLTALIASVVVALLLRAFVLHAYRIPSASMEDTLLVGDFLIAERISFGANVELPWARSTGIRLPSLRTPSAGEVVVFREWNNGEAEYIKRCAGLAGDTIEMVGGTLLVNDEPFDRLLAIMTGSGARVKHLTELTAQDDPHYAYRHFTGRLRNFGPHVVPPGHIFVIGDNRDNSEDSRMRGDVPLTAMRGSPLFIYWSVDPDAPWWNFARRIRWERIGTLVR